MLNRRTSFDQYYLEEWSRRNTLDPHANEIAVAAILETILAV